MKTLTEFDGFRLKNALNTKKELIAAGKTPEELPAALGEALKLEGDKLSLMLAALEVAETRSDNIKRIVVFAAEEGKPGPKGAVQKEDKHFLAEYFFSPQAQPRGPREGRDGGRGGRGGKKGRGGKRGGRGGREGGGDRGPRREGAPAEASREGGGGGERRPRPRRGGGKPGEPGAKPNVKPNVTPKTQAPTENKTEDKTPQSS